MSSEPENSAPSPGTSPQRPAQIHVAMTEALKMVKAIYKDRRNEQQRFNFRSVDDVYLALRPALETQGITILPVLRMINYDVIMTAKGKAMNFCRVTVEYHFTAQDGSTVMATVPGEGMDSADKATAKAMSVAYKTAMFQVFCIPCEEDERDRDGDYTDPMPEGRAAPTTDTPTTGTTTTSYCTPEQLEQLHAAGETLCGSRKAWLAYAPELATWASNGGVTDIQDLTQDEAAAAISDLNTKINSKGN